LTDRDTSSLLRRILLVDALVSAGAGLVMALGAGLLEERLGLPATLLRWAGFSLLPFAVLLVGLSRSAPPPRSAVVAVIALNAAWVAASVLILFADAVQPNALGYAFVLVQAAAVALLAEVEVVGLRRVAS